MQRTHGPSHILSRLRMVTIVPGEAGAAEADDRGQRAPRTTRHAPQDGADGVADLLRTSVQVEDQPLDVRAYKLPVGGQLEQLATDLDDIQGRPHEIPFGKVLKDIGVQQDASNSV